MSSMNPNIGGPQWPGAVPGAPAGSPAAGPGGQPGRVFDLGATPQTGEGGVEHILTPNDMACRLYIQAGYTSWEDKDGTFYSLTPQNAAGGQWLSMTTYQKDSSGNHVNQQNYPDAYFIVSEPKTPDPYHTRYIVYTGPNKIPAPYLNYDKLVTIPNNVGELNKYLPGFHQELMQQMALQIMNNLKQAQQSYKESLQGETS